MVKGTACNAGDTVLIPGWGKIPWRRAWQPTPVFLPGESLWIEEPRRLQFRLQSSLEGYSVDKESIGMIEWLILSHSFMAPQFSSIFTPYVSIFKEYCVLSLYFLFILNSINWNAHNGLCVLYSGVLILISCVCVCVFSHKITMKDFLVLAKIILELWFVWWCPLF